MGGNRYRLEGIWSLGFAGLLCGARACVELLERELGFSDHGAQEGAREARVVTLCLLDGLPEKLERSVKQRAVLWRILGQLGRFEGRPGVRPELLALLRVLGLEQAQEPSGVASRQTARGEGEHGGDLLLCGKLRKLEGERRAKEVLREELAGLWIKTVGDLQPACDPAAPLAECGGDGRLAHAVLAGEVLEGVELFGKRGAAGGVVELQTGDLGLGKGPVPHPRPGLRCASLDEGQRASVPIDQDEPTIPVARRDERIVTVQLGGAAHGRGLQLERERRERDSLHRHRASPLR